MNQGKPRSDTNRTLELELIRVRAEAAAVRLEARAAEIELLLLAHADSRGESDMASVATLSIHPCMDQVASGLSQPGQRADGGASAAGSEDGEHSDAFRPAAENFSSRQRLDAAEALVTAIRQLVAVQQNSRSGAASGEEAGGPVTSAAIGLWQQRIEALRRRAPQAAGDQQTALASPGAQSPATLPTAEAGADVPGNAADDQPRAAEDGGGPDLDVAARMLRFDAPAETLSAPQLFKRLSEQLGANDAGGAADALTPQAEQLNDAEPGPAEVSGGAARRLEPIDIVPAGPRAGRGTVWPVELLPADIQWSQEEMPEPARRRLRPAGWLASMLAHIAVLVLLGLMTLSAQKPRDQLAFSASASESSENMMETFTIQTSEAVPEDSQPQPAETALDISALGTLQATEVSLDLPAAPPAVAADLLSSQASSMSSLAQASLKGDTSSKVQFAGIDGGGNHFIYLVDSSLSMRNFNEARMELLRSVDSLQDHQRFYVAFYDQNPDFMRLLDPNADQPTSVLATPANKLALRRWAMTIQQERGKSPIDVLPFAFKLRPDVIFLLSDGEFSARTEEVIREHNRQENLFGEAGPISIIHTIRYPGYSATEARNAEVQMKRIAEENGGQYRNVAIK